MKKNANALWIVVLDSRRGRLLRGQTVPPGRAHLEVLETIENEEEEHEHGRPSPRRSKDGHSYADWGHEDDEQLQRNARRVAGWIDTQRKSHGIDRLTVFSPPRFAGALRTQYAASLAKSIDQKQLDLGNLEPGELVKHPAIAEMFRSL